MSDERIWLKHGEHGGYFHCPTAAAEDYLGLGWQVADEPPVEENPVVAENVAWHAAQAAEREAAEKATKKSKTSRGSGTDTDAQE